MEVRLLTTVTPSSGVFSGYWFACVTPRTTLYFVDPDGRVCLECFTYNFTESRSDLLDHLRFVLRGENSLHYLDIN